MSSNAKNAGMFLSSCVFAVVMKIPPHAHHAEGAKPKSSYLLFHLPHPVRATDLVAVWVRLPARHQEDFPEPAKLTAVRCAVSSFTEKGKLSGDNIIILDNDRKRKKG